MAKQPLLETLEAAYRDHHSHYSRERDPLSLVHGYPSAADQEVAGFLTALLSYGSVPIILASARKVLAVLGSSPAKTLKQPFFHESLSAFRHRFTTGEDFEIVFHWLYTALQSHGSLEAFFLNGEDPNRPMKAILSGFVRRLTTQELPQRLVAKKARRDRQLKYLISDPERGSACKRLNMFLRWMVRPADGVDLGIWKGVQPKNLILPLDTHLLQTIQALKWTRSSQATWRLAEEATTRLKRLCPDDPVRYDFALCHLSMEGGGILHYKAGR